MLLVTGPVRSHLAAGVPNLNFLFADDTKPRVGQRGSWFPRDLKEHVARIDDTRAQPIDCLAEAENFTICSLAKPKF